MKRAVWFCVVVVLCLSSGFAQQSPTASSAAGVNAVVPTLVNFSGTLTDVNGKPLSGIQGVTFALYKEDQGGAPLWMETQNVEPDRIGRYTVMLGATTSTGLPANLFATGDAHWLGVQISGQEEQPRVLLVSMPFALKAGDAETAAGLPPSAFAPTDAPIGTSSGTAATARVTQHEVIPPATVTGSGTTNYIPIWTNSTTLGNSLLYQTGGKVGIGTTAPGSKLDVSGYINTTAGFRIGSKNVLTLAGSVTDSNIALGYSAFPSNAFGTLDTAIGAFALNANAQGQFDTATGAFASSSNTYGSNNTATGAYALYANTLGAGNTATGNFALNANTTGNDNIAIGYQAASKVSGDNSNNIHIGSVGSSADSGVIRIGTSGNQTSFFVAGVTGVTTGLPGAIPVMIDANGQLGTVSSSRRFKQDIQDMGEASRGLMLLRPVTFRYQRPFDDGSKPIQYGLIAEEVAEVYPDLVAHSADGQIETVQYQVLDSMLLNEVQHQQAEIRELRQRLAKMEAALASMSHTPDVAQVSAVTPK